MHRWLQIVLKRWAVHVIVAHIRWQFLIPCIIMHVAESSLDGWVVLELVHITHPARSCVIWILKWHWIINIWCPITNDWYSQILLKTWMSLYCLHGDWLSMWTYETLWYWVIFLDEIRRARSLYGWNWSLRIMHIYIGVSRSFKGLKSWNGGSLFLTFLWHLLSMF